MNSSKEIAENYLDIGVKKTTMPALRMLVLGILAGAFIAIAGVGAATAGASIALPSVSKLVGACIFPAGLAMITLTGCELFTGNSLLVIPLLERRISPGGLLKNWILVYIGNLIGSLIIAGLCVLGGVYSLFGSALAGNVISTACAKVSLSFGDAFFKGILCNFLVCTGVWMAFASKTAGGKIAGVFFPIMIFVLCGFEHCVANMYYIPAGIWASLRPEYMSAATADVSVLTWGAFFGRNLLPVTLGNIVGGAVGMGVPMWYAFLHTDKSKKTAAEK